MSQLLYLFSSNQRPLYAQDILDLLAAPKGHRFRFRYFSEWVEPTTRKEWQSLKGCDTLTHFSIQQRAEYHNPAFVPVRFGHVTETETLGDILIVEFEVGSYASLRPQSPEPRKKESERRIYGKPVQDYWKALDSAKVPKPYDSWAGLGDNIRGLLDTGAEGTEPSPQQALFEAVAKFLYRTETFRSALYYRVLSLRQSGVTVTGETTSGLEPVDGKFELQGGRSYELVLAHYQPTDVQGRHEFSVSVDDSILRVIGKPSFEVSSSYDIVKIPVFAPSPPTVDARETVLAIDPPAGTIGPQLRLRVLVKPDKRRTAVAVAGTTVAAFSVALPGLAPQLPVASKIVVGALGIVLFAGLSVLGFKRS